MHLLKAQVYCEQREREKEGGRHQDLLPQQLFILKILISTRKLKSTTVNPIQSSLRLPHCQHLVWLRCWWRAERRSEEGAGRVEDRRVRARRAGRGRSIGVLGSVSMWPLGGAAGRTGRDRGRFVGQRCPRVTHCGGGRMSQPSKGFLRPHVPRFPPWRRPGRLHRADPWERPEPGAPPCRCAHSPRSRPLEASFSASAREPGPAAKPGVGLRWAALRAACCAVWVRTRPAACIFFSGARAPGRDFAGSGQAAPWIPGRLLPWSSLSWRRQASFLGEVRGQRVRAAGSPGAALQGRLWGWAGWYFLWEAGVPCSPFGSHFDPEPVQGPALAWAGIRGTSSCQGWAVGGAQREACQNHWERACSVSWVCQAVFASSQSKSEGIGSPAS